MKPTAKCLQCGREQTTLVRGLCYYAAGTTCYMRSYQLIKKGETTWEQLVSEGKALKSKYE